MVTESMSTAISVLMAANLPSDTLTVVLGGEVGVHHRAVLVMGRRRIAKMR